MVALHPFEERFPRLWAFLEQVSVLVLTSLAFWLFIWILPAAIVAMFSAVGTLVRPVRGDLFGRFWRGLWRTWGRAMLLGLINLAAVAILLGDIWILRTYVGGTVGQVAALFFGSLLLVLAVISVYAWTLLAWYPQPLGKLLKRAFLLGIAHPFHAMGGLLGAAVVMLGLFSLPGALQGLGAALGPGASATVIGMAAWQAMKRYATDEDEFSE